MTTLTKPLHRFWKSAQLYIGFHTDPKGRKRQVPHVWPPKNARATIQEDPAEQETFVVVKSAARDSAQDVQIKLRPDMIVLCRDASDAWEGVIVEQSSVAVKVGGVSIRIGHDGTITREGSDTGRPVLGPDQTETSRRNRGSDDAHRCLGARLFCITKKGRSYIAPSLMHL